MLVVQTYVESWSFAWTIVIWAHPKQYNTNYVLKMYMDLGWVKGCFLRSTMGLETWKKITATPLLRPLSLARGQKPRLKALLRITMVWETWKQKWPRLKRTCCHIIFCSCAAIWSNFHLRNFFVPLLKIFVRFGTNSVRKHCLFSL